MVEKQGVMALRGSRTASAQIICYLLELIPRDGGHKQNFTMIFPPPNITGNLHLGHALTISLQDAMIRYRHMKGYNVKWIPGTDHAGIATQSVVERLLYQQEGVMSSRMLCLYVDVQT
jgi:valyl-tRNA synthetase